MSTTSGGAPASGSGGGAPASGSDEGAESSACAGPSADTVRNLVSVLAAARLGRAAEAALIKAVTGREERRDARAAGAPGISVATLAGTILLPYVPFTDHTTLGVVKKALCEKYPDYVPALTVTYVGNTYTEGRKVLPEVADEATSGAQLLEMGDTVFVVITKAHDMRITSTRAEYERGDMHCSCCERKGPSRYTSHIYCADCKLCGMCCIEHGSRCGGRVEVAASRADTGAPVAKAALLAEFYKWQRGIMKPY